MIWSAVISVGLDATTDPKKEKGLIVDEKQYRVTNYVTSLHEGLFNIHC
jgi:glutamate synthase domain-containing protein 2